MECVVCGGAGFQEIYNGTLVKCKKCSFITANLSISKEELAAIYNSNYYDSNEVRDYLATQKSKHKNFSFLLDWVQGVCQPTDLLNVLEIGCAHGFFGSTFSKRFPEYKYTGVDISTDAVNFAKNVMKLNAICCDFLSSRVSNSEYTTVFIWDAIEHLMRPDKFLHKINKELKLGGKVVICTPDISGIVPKFRGAKWRNIHPPTHLHYFTPQTMKVLLAKNGFEIISLDHLGVHRNVKSTLKRLLGNSLFYKYLELAINLLPDNLTYYLNTYDNMQLVAKKTKELSDSELGGYSCFQ